ncbi:MAG: PAS domain S-box protein [Desulfobacterales bacterium]|nr:PAS domain S-box protein [Desulfobacterales bacterium]
MTIENRRILVIDDDPEILSAYKSVLAPRTEKLSSAGRQLSMLLMEDSEAESEPVFQVTYATQGQEGLDLVQEGLQINAPFAAAFIDIRMPPGMDGMETASRIRRLDANIEIVIITAFSDRTRKAIVEKVGSPEKLLFFRKPIDSDELAQLALSLTEKWNVETKLQEREKRFRETIDQIPFVMEFYDPRGNRVFLNKQWEKLYGGDRDAEAGKMNLFHDEAKKRELEPYIDSAFAGEMTSLPEKKFIPEEHGLEGPCRWLKSRFVPIRGAENDLLYVVLMHEDITERKNAETGRERLSAILENTSDVVVISTIDLKVIYMNSAGRKLFGLMEENYGDKTLYDLHPEWASRIIEGKGLPGAVEHGVWEGESALLRADGAEIPVSQLIISHKSPDGKLDYYSTIIRDISEQKRAEAELYTNTLKKSEAKLKQIIDLVPHMVFAKNAEGRFLLVNKAMADSLGATPEELTGKLHQEFHPDPGEAERMLASDLSVIRDGRRVDNLEESFKDVDGRTRWLQTAKLPYVSADTSEPAVLGLSVDITVLKESEEKLKKAKEEADAASRAKSEFLANMSHELRTPLNAVTGFCELLSSLVSDSKQKTYLEGIKTGGKSLLTLINDILDLSKIEAGKMDIKSEPVNVKEIFKEMEQIFRMRVNQKNLDFEIDIDPDLPSTLLLDETRVRQIMLNLVGNAVKFTEKGGIRLSVRKKKTRSSSHIDLLLSVEDTGIGIPPEDQEKIFESFKQQDGQSTRKFGGTGLGLTISKRLVEMMNGRISLKSVVGDGSAFDITLREVGVSSFEIPPVDQDSFDIENISFEGAKTLIVDDIRSNRNLIREMLLSVKMEIATGENGHEAILLAEEYQPDVIIMDIRMPVMDGLEATKILKKNPKTKDIPVIAVTASVQAGARERMLETGLDGYLTKPVTIHELIDELKRYLPYTERRATEPPRPESARNIDAMDEIRTAPGLIRVLKEEVLPECDVLNRAMTMSEIDAFGKKLKKLGQDFKVESLNGYGDILHECAFHYNIIEIDAVLKELSTMQEKL